MVNFLILLLKVITSWVMILTVCALMLVDVVSTDLGAVMLLVVGLEAALVERCPPYVERVNRIRRSARV